MSNNFEAACKAI